MKMNNEPQITFKNDIPQVDCGTGNKIYVIPVEWIATDIVNIRANSFEEAIEIFQEHIDKIPLGAKPGYITESYRIAADSQNISEIAEEIKYIFGDEISFEYE